MCVTFFTLNCSVIYRINFFDLVLLNSLLEIYMGMLIFFLAFMLHYALPCQSIFSGIPMRINSYIDMKLFLIYMGMLLLFLASMLHL